MQLYQYLTVTNFSEFLVTISIIAKISVSYTYMHACFNFYVKQVNYYDYYAKLDVHATF